MAGRVGFEPTGPQRTHKFSRLGRYDHSGTFPNVPVSGIEPLYSHGLAGVSCVCLHLTADIPST